MKFLFKTAMLVIVLQGGTSAAHEKIGFIPSPASADEVMLETNYAAGVGYETYLVYAADLSTQTVKPEISDILRPVGFPQIAFAGSLGSKINRAIFGKTIKTQKRRKARGRRAAKKVGGKVGGIVTDKARGVATGGASERGGGEDKPRMRQK